MTSVLTPPAASFRSAQWRMLLVTMSCYLCYYTGRQNFGFAAKAMQEELRLSGAALGTMSAALLLAYGIGQAVNGNLCDRYGPRVLVPVGAIGSFLLNWATSFGEGFVGILIPWAANGYLQSFGWAPSCKMIANWWRREEHGRAYGWLLLSAGFSSVMTFALCLWVLHHWDWRYVFRFPVLLLAAGGVLFALLARNSPEDLGFASGSASGEPAPGKRYYREVLTNRSFLIATLSIGFESIARYGLLYWVPVRFLGPDWRRNPGSAWVTLALPVGMALGAFCAGHLSDRYFRGNRRRPIALFLALATVVSAALAFVPVTWWAVGAPLLAAAGFLVYGPQAAYWALCPELVGRERAGTATGLMDAAAYAFAAAGEILIGHAIDWTGTTAAVFYVVPLSCAAGSLAILGVKEAR